MPHAPASGFPSPCVLLADLVTPVGQDRLILPVCDQAITNYRKGNTHRDDGDRGGQAPALRKNQARWAILKTELIFFLKLIANMW